MKQNIVPIAMVAMLVLLLGLYLASNQSGQLPEQGLLFDQQDVANIEKLVLKNHEGEVLTAFLQQGKWWISWSDNGVEKQYEADRGKLSTFLQQLVEAKTVEAKTTKAQNYVRLGVEAIEETDSQALLLSIWADGQQWPGLLMGKKASSGYGQYVRYAQQEQSWLIDKQFELPMLYNDWLQQPILTLNKASIESVQARLANGHILWQLNQQKNTLSLQHMPEAGVLKYDAVLSNYLDNMLAIQFQGLKLKAELEQELLNLQIILHIQTQNEEQVEVAIYQDKQQNYWLAPSSEKGEQWYYQISDIGFSQLNKSKQDFLQPQESSPKEKNTPVEEGISPQ